LSDTFTQEIHTRPGRKPLPESERKTYERQPISLRPDQWQGLKDGAVAFDIHSRSGPRHGQHSWRTMIALAAEHLPMVIQAMRKVQNGETKYPVVIPIAKGVSLLIEKEDS